MGAHPTPNPPKPTKISRLKTFLDQLDPHPWDFDFDEPGFQPRPFFARVSGAELVECGVWSVK